MLARQVDGIIYMGVTEKLAVDLLKESNDAGRRRNSLRFGQPFPQRSHQRGQGVRHAHPTHA